MKYKEVAYENGRTTYKEVLCEGGKVVYVVSMAIEDIKTRMRASKSEDRLIAGDQDLWNFNRTRSGIR